MTNAVTPAGDRDPFGDLGQRFHLVSTIRVMRSATGGGSSRSSAGVASTVALPGDGGVVCLCHSPNFGEGVRIGQGDGRLHRESWVQESRHW